MTVHCDRDTVTLRARPQCDCAAPYYVGVHTHSQRVCSATVQHSPAQWRELGCRRPARIKAPPSRKFSKGLDRAPGADELLQHAARGLLAVVASLPIDAHRTFSPPRSSQVDAVLAVPRLDGPTGRPTAVDHFADLAPLPAAPAGGAS
ncbi:MAG: hypothetical protein AMXMBFR56_81730 [Polyangiaceae bacterium]